MNFIVIIKQYELDSNNLLWLQLEPEPYLWGSSGSAGSAKRAEYTTQILKILGRLIIFMFVLNFNFTSRLYERLQEERGITFAEFKESAPPHFRPPDPPPPLPSLPSSRSVLASKLERKKRKLSKKIIPFSWLQQQKRIIHLKGGGGGGGGLNQTIAQGEVKKIVTNFFIKWTQQMGNSQSRVVNLDELA